VAWRDALGAGPVLTVRARSRGSRLSALPSIQAVAQRAIVDSVLGRRSRSSSAGPLAETGPRATVEVALRGDRCRVLLDTSGQGLHRRGYRVEGGEAPLRETLAAALVLLSRWRPGEPFADPMCGSGTIAIEAAMFARAIPPGLQRSFAAEQFPLFPGAGWRDAREQAAAAAAAGKTQRDASHSIAASDRDARAVAAARRNARRAGVLDAIRFQRAALEDFSPPEPRGCLVCNPPYGERLGAEGQAEAVVRELGQLYRRLGGWSLFVLSPHPRFQQLFGVRAARNRKLYNGNIRCWLYQYPRRR
jgi:putative N6-adenine-specific DNA methylase